MLSRQIPSRDKSVLQSVDLPSSLHVVSGNFVILGGLGLILPSLFRIQTRLTPQVLDS